MSAKGMRSLLAALCDEAGRSIQRPAEPRVVMEEFCRAMSVLVDRPICLVFRSFPPDVPVSGMRLGLADKSVIVVDDDAVPEAQGVILGHELWHEWQHHQGHGGCGSHGAGLPVAARALRDDDGQDAVQRAMQLILDDEDVPLDAHAVMAVAARSESGDDHEIEAETFGLRFGVQARTFMTGRYAQSPVSPATVEGRLHLSMLNRGGHIL
ncbi:toxin [Streptomyces europaeiscabiei]|uniref:toxin n=1 Tax=Streptomyces europaeiscabiei TaxID=146819 RepID=UPI0029BE6848|nr:toxin [Streptomyces europaeiscabiei]MDX3694831.1 toxin [Streptomyces europaeiscabiei]